MTEINDDLRYRVGIDVGLKSIGFCAVEVDDKDQPLRLLNSMVFIHDAGVDPNENKAAKSRKLTAGVARRILRIPTSRGMPARSLSITTLRTNPSAWKHCRLRSGTWLVIVGGGIPISRSIRS